MNNSIPIVPHEIAHHFDTAEQEFQTAKLGMWAFIGQEVLFFGGLFVAYIVFRYLYPNMFIDASSHLSWKMGGLNTIVLLLSSFTMAMAVRSAQKSQVNLSAKFLIATLVCACIFLIVKYFEYSEKIHHGYLPYRWFAGEGMFENMHLFFGLYFTMTGLHGLHVLIGIGLIGWLIKRTYKGHFHAEFYTPVEMVGLYWHIVDIIWIFIFPLLYLIG